MKLVSQPFETSFVFHGLYMSHFELLLIALIS